MYSHCLLQALYLPRPLQPLLTTNVTFAYNSYIVFTSTNIAFCARPINPCCAIQLPTQFIQLLVIKHCISLNKLYSSFLSQTLYLLSRSKHPSLIRISEFSVQGRINTAYSSCVKHLAILQNIEYQHVLNISYRQYTAMMSVAKILYCDILIN